jgi:hypothetical protein
VKVIFEGGGGEENGGGAGNEDNEGNDATGRVRRSNEVEGVPGVQVFHRSGLKSFTVSPKRSVRRCIAKGQYPQGVPLATWIGYINVSWCT